MESELFSGWAILELMGHRKLAGHVTSVEIAGKGMLRIDVPANDGQGMTATQFYSPEALYCLTPTSEEIARRISINIQPEPVVRWMLPELPKEELEEIYENGL